jgi:hypothetical protein
MRSSTANRERNVAFSPLVSLERIFCFGRVFGFPVCKNLSVNSVNLGSRRQAVGIERCKLGEDRFQDASDQVMDRLGYVLVEG